MYILDSKSSSINVFEMSILSLDGNRGPDANSKQHPQCVNVLTQHVVCGLLLDHHASPSPCVGSTLGSWLLFFALVEHWRSRNVDPNHGVVAGSEKFKSKRFLRVGRYRNGSRSMQKSESRRLVLDSQVQELPQMPTGS